MKGGKICTKNNKFFKQKTQNNRCYQNTFPLSCPSFLSPYPPSPSFFFLSPLSLSLLSLTDYPFRLSLLYPHFVFCEMAAATLDYSRFKAENDSRVAEQARREQMRRSALVLILSHLQAEGYGKAVYALETEAGVSLDRYEVCDNVDLLTIIQEYEAFYAIKFNRPPKLIKKVRAFWWKRKRKKEARKRGGRRGGGRGGRGRGNEK